MLISYYYAGNFNVRCGNAVSGTAAVGWERMKTGGRACQRRERCVNVMHKIIHVQVLDLVVALHFIIKYCFSRSTVDLSPILQKVDGYRGLNSRFSTSQADVITTTPRNLVHDRKSMLLINVRYK